MKYTVRSVDKYEFQLPRKADFSTDFTVEVKKGKALQVRILETNADGSIRLVMVNNRVVPVQVEKRTDGLPERVYVNGVSYPLEIEKVESTRFKAPSSAKEASGAVKADLPGQVSSLFVAVGDSIEKGQPLGILEAMKMENEIIAPRSGKIKAIHAPAGKAVMRGDLILEIS